MIIDPEYHYETVNVEAQQSNPSSLLWWVKRLITLRKRFRTFGRGTFELLRPENSKVLAFIREFEDERILVVANLSRFVQYVQLDLKDYAGIAPEEVLGRTPFPQITDQPYLLTLGPHGFIWFSLADGVVDRDGKRSGGVSAINAPEIDLPVLPGKDRWPGDSVPGSGTRSRPSCRNTSCVAGCWNAGCESRRLRSCTRHRSAWARLTSGSC